MKTIKTFKEIKVYRAENSTKNINQLIPTYNDITTSAYSTPSVFLNGKLSIININLLDIKSFCYSFKSL